MKKKELLPDNIEIIITIIIIIKGEEVAAEEVEKEEADPFMKLKKLLNNSLTNLLKKLYLRTPPRTQIFLLKRRQESDLPIIKKDRVRFSIKKLQRLLKKRKLLQSNHLQLNLPINQKTADGKLRQFLQFLPNQTQTLNLPPEALDAGNRSRLERINRTPEIKIQIQLTIRSNF